MIITLILFLIIVGLCCAQFYLKFSPLQAFAMLICCLVGAFVAFGYFELLGGLILSKVPGFLLPWLYGVCFLFLFGLATVLLYVATTFVVGAAIDFGPMAKTICTVTCGAISGVILTGVLVVFMGLLPMMGMIPYARFDSENINIHSPKSAFLNVDGLVTGLFSWVSSGSLKGGTTFAAQNPRFLDRIHLARLMARGETSVFPIAGNNAIEVPRKDGVRIQEDENRTLIQLAINGQPVTEGGAQQKSDSEVRFLLGQIRLLCVPKGTQDVGATAALVVYPSGYFQGGALQEASPGEVFQFGGRDMEAGPFRQSAWMQLVFDVPRGMEPARIQFKANAMAEVPKPSKPDEES